jgi:hypothetical protein
MEPDEKMIITCTSEKQMESLRVSLYRQRQAWQKANVDGSDVGVTSSRQGGKFILIIEKLEPVPAPVIITGEGRIKKVVDLAEPAPTVIESDDERVAIEFTEDQERKRQLMREDGISEEEIAAYFKEKAS